MNIGDKVICTSDVWRYYITYPQEGKTYKIIGGVDSRFLYFEESGGHVGFQKTNFILDCKVTRAMYGMEENND